MKTIKLAAAVAALAALLFVALPNLAWAQNDGAALYKAKCAMCHGADAAGKPAMKAPALKGKTAADLMNAQKTDAKHPAALKSLTPDQVNAIGAYLSKMM